MLKPKRINQEDTYREGNMSLTSTKLYMLAMAAAPLTVTISMPTIASAQVFKDEIIVTATKREESSQNVGISLTAVSGDQIKALGYTNAQQITALAPGVSTVQPNGESNYSVAIRGAANSDFTTNVESPVALYVDETYISQSSGSGFQLFDIERVEVLRGPQGTLFGRNATGGLIHYISVKPGDELDGYINLGFGSFDTFRAQGAFNLPIDETVNGRVSFATNQGDGYVLNRVRPDELLNNSNDFAGRAQLWFTPSENFDYLVTARYGSQDIRTGFFENVSAPLPTGAAQFLPNGDPAPNPALNGFSDNDGDVFAGEFDFPGRNQLETYSFSGSGNLDLGWATLTSITDYQSVDRDYIEDSDASPFNFFNFFLTTDAEQFSQELRLAGENERLKWVGGFYYIDIDIADSNGGIAPGFIANFVNLLSGQVPSNVDFDNLEAEVANAGFNGVDNPYTQNTRSWSLFGQVDYAVTDQLTLTLGGRFTSESKDFQYNNNGVLFDDVAVSGRDPRTQIIAADLVPEFQSERDDDLWSVRAVLDYELNENVLIYGGYNRGVRGGGFNAPLLPGITDVSFYEYDPETLNAYEIGLKATLASGVRFNASAYYYDYNDYQAFSIVGLDTFTQNARAENYGFEAELQANPVAGLDLLLGVGYINANVSDVPGINTDAFASDGSLIAAGFREGDIVPVQTPTWNVNGLVRYEFPTEVFGGVFAWQGDFQWRSEHAFNLSGVDSSIEDGYAVVNSSISWSPANQNWNLQFRADNLFDEEYLVQTFDLSGTLDTGGFFGMIEEYYGRPRQWSVMFNYDF